MIRSVHFARFALSVIASTAVSAAFVTPGVVGAEERASPGNPGTSSDPTQAQRKLIKSELAPHSVMIETALKASQTEIEGIRSQLKAEEGRQSAESIDHYKIYSKEIRDNANTLATHQAHLKEMSKKFSNVASSKEFREANAAIDEYRNLATRWESKASTSAYWNDRSQVSNDLDSLVRRIDTAMNKTKGFNSSQLDLSTSLG